MCELRFYDMPNRSRIALLLPFALCGHSRDHPSVRQQAPAAPVICPVGLALEGCPPKLLQGNASYASEWMDAEASDQREH